MAKKKRVRKRQVSRVKRRTPRRTTAEKVYSTKRKISLIFKNLVLFAVLCVLSYLSYMVLSVSIYKDISYLLFWIFGFIAVAFLIVLLIFLILRVLKR